MQGKGGKMIERPVIIVDTDGFAKFCDNRCNNTKCKKHLSQMRGYYGGAKISKLRDTSDCKEGITQYFKGEGDL